MRNLIKVGMISTAISTMPLNVNADGFRQNQDILKNQTNTELSTALTSESGKKIEKVCVEPKVVTKAILDYFDEEVKLYKLGFDAKAQISGVLNSYFSAHNVLNIDDDGRMEFVLDNKREFALMAKKVMNIVIGDMPFFVRKVVIPLFLGGNDAIQEKFDKLDDTMMNMNEKQYKLLILDYIAGIVRRVEDSLGGKFTIGDYYRDISHYYPNKEGKQILEELNNSGQANLDIKNYKYQR